MKTYFKENWFVILFLVLVVAIPLAWAASSTIPDRTELAEAPNAADEIALYDASATTGKSLGIDNLFLYLGAAHDTAAELTALFAGKEGTLTNSAGLLSALSDETGTGVAVFSTSPTLVTPILGTITSGVGTALTALDGENIQDNTIDVDSLDWGAFTDLGEGGAVTWGNIAEGELANSTVVSADIKDGVIVDADVAAAAAIAMSKVAWPTTITTRDADATPEVAPGGFYKLTNTGALTVTNFIDSEDGETAFSNGDEILILLDDADITIDFSENADIEGNAGVDFTASASQVTLLHFVYENTRWNCTNLTIGMSSPTVLALSAIDMGGGTLEIPNGTDASPSVAGQIRHDSTVTGLETGAIAWYDGDEVRYLVDLETLPVDDDYVVAYDADNDIFYMKADAGAGAAGTVTTIEDGDSQVGGADIVTIDFDGTVFAVTEDPDTEINVDIADDGIDSQHYAAASIDNEHLADDAVGTAEIATDAVTMDSVDADGDFTSLTGDWATTGYVSGQANTLTDTSGVITLTVNAVNYGSDTGKANIPDGACDAAADVGNWVVLISSVADAYQMTSDDESNQFIIAANAAALTANDELDVDGTMVSVMCIAAELWKVTGYMGAIPTDGGAP